MADISAEISAILNISPFVPLSFVLTYAKFTLQLLIFSQPKSTVKFGVEGK
ncbi:hypothetical protein [Paraglaciecola chathamensis]|uniref:hypothetical protein n=1 Tax=Paraglaciecola chathamensis TaxID=368405 RepID=UPI0017849E50|nr:hypothetical protein [Paraglaciecola oceanifecundans]